ncbi:TadE/TadG family type IV pilus assembly protein [Vibrio cholerae]|uniref:TadE/TadG family type IV pilus assembly protein n=1 Tax=Vibrio cholerae TaxID=666 RepID=UPI001C22C824|nr:MULTISPECIES: TadE family protein [Vibrio]MCD1216107.1 hypothetical protein [Vibrio cholerae]MCD1234466.1 hypothetical protein [Vibrio cholerae]MCD1241715.1 hypothetical protein [Vibrio cholerae]MCD1256422.1 hypothetical protein [Vibrio cholerae]QXC57479.1 pilus assembly protein [Vibrio mimicus]
MKRYRKGQAGVASIETALMLPIVLAVMMMFFDVSRLHLQYALLDHSMRHSLRTLLAEDWRVKPLNRGVILRMVEARSFGFLEGVEIEVREYPSLEALMQVRLDEEAKLEEAVRPADPVFRISAKLTTQLAYSPLAWFQPEPLRYQSTLVLSKELLFK